MTARSAANSCQNPSAAFKTSTAAIAAASTVSPIRTETTVAATNRRDQRVEHLVEDEPKILRPARRPRSIPPIAGKASRCLGGRQAEPEVAVQRDCHRLGGSRMGLLRGVHRHEPSASGPPQQALLVAAGRWRVYDEHGAVGSMCDTLADAPQRTDTVQAARAHKHQVCLQRAVEQAHDGMTGIPRVHSLAQSPSRSSSFPPVLDTTRTMEPSRAARSSATANAASEDSEPSTPTTIRRGCQRLTPLRASQQDRAGGLVQECGRRLTRQDAEEPTAAATAEGEQRGVVLAAGGPQDGLCVAADDRRRAVRSSGRDLGRRRTRPLCLLFQKSRHVAHVEACVDGDARVERSNGVHGRGWRDQRKSLMQRLEAIVGSIDANDHAIERTHDRRVSESPRCHIRADAEPDTYFKATSTSQNAQ